MSTPWFKFYPSDWRADPALRMCSMAARGLWMEMLCVMHEATPRGVLLVNGLAVTDRQLAGLAGLPLKETISLLAELEAAGVFSRDESARIYSRRMRRDDEKAARDKGNGSKGGNPGLKRGVNPTANPGVEKGDKAQKPEARVQKPERKNNDPPRPTTGAGPGVDGIWDRTRLDELHRRLVEDGGIGLAPVAAHADLSVILGLLGAGYDLDLDVIPGIRAAMASEDFRPSRWKAFVGWIEVCRRDRLAAGAPRAEERTSGTTPPTISAAVLDSFAENYVRSRDWPQAMILEPGTAGSPVTAEHLERARVRLGRAA